MCSSDLRDGHGLAWMQRGDSLTRGGEPDASQAIELGLGEMATIQKCLSKNIDQNH